MTLLTLKNVSKSFGALKVTDGVSLSVTEGEVLGILGPNGAGKTTLFNLISGDLQVDAGAVEFDGLPITSAPPFQRCRDGIGRSYQVPQPFGAMSVFENLVTAACFGAQVTEKKAWEIGWDVLQQTGLQPSSKSSPDKGARHERRRDQTSPRCRPDPFRGHRRDRKSVV